MTDIHHISPKRTNCGRPTYRFDYKKHGIRLHTPCFEPTCNTCTLRQPAIAAFELSPDCISPLLLPEQEYPLAAAAAQSGREQRRRQSFAEVQERLRRLSDWHVRNAPPVKRRGVESGRVEKKCGRYGFRFRRRVVLRFDRRLNEYRNQVRQLKNKRKQQRSKCVVLNFRRRDSFARVLGQLAEGEGGMAPRPEEGRKLFLVIGKNDTLSCRWK